MVATTRAVSDNGVRSEIILRTGINADAVVVVCAISANVILCYYVVRRA